MYTFLAGYVADAVGQGASGPLFLNSETCLIVTTLLFTLDYDISYDRRLLVN